MLARSVAPDVISNSAAISAGANGQPGQDQIEIQIEISDTLEFQSDLR